MVPVTAVIVVELTHTTEVHAMVPIFRVGVATKFVPVTVIAMGPSL
jgi:hypothetical protein